MDTKTGAAGREGFDGDPATPGATLIEEVHLPDPHGDALQTKRVELCSCIDSTTGFLYVQVFLGDRLQPVVAEGTVERALRRATSRPSRLRTDNGRAHEALLPDIDPIQTTSPQHDTGAESPHGSAPHLKTLSQLNQELWAWLKQHQPSSSSV